MIDPTPHFHRSAANCFTRFLLSGLSLLAAALVCTATAAANNEPDFRLLDSLPVQDGGRKKPFFVFAQESMLALTGRTRLALEGEKIEADEVIGRMWVRDRDWSNVPMILVDYLPLKRDAGLAAERKLFSYDELIGNEAVRRLLGEAAAARKNEAGGALRGILKEAASVGLRLDLFERLTNGTAMRVVPKTHSAWGTIPDETPEFQQLSAAVLQGDGKAFAEAAESLSARLAMIEHGEQPPAWKLQLEVIYQRIHPFRIAWIFYALAVIVLGLTAGIARKGGYIAAWSLIGAGAVLLVAGFIARILISGRAPVTNMYESIIWVAFGTVLFALIFEAVFRSRIFFLGAAPVAVVSLMVADAAPLKFDPHISPLVPVLQSNFWLTTHVLTITLSYAAFALALGVAHVGLIGFLRRGRLDAAVANYVYRSLQIGVFLLATGTILGAVWANYSWGRFWDWDPKETWALVALLSYLFLLHGRIAGKWGGFGLCIGAVLAFQTIIMAWYGVNFILGAGLHSYGFGSGGRGWAAAFVLLELGFVGAVLLRRALLRKIPPSTTAASSAGTPAS